MKSILAHPEEVRKVTERARALAFSDYDWDTVAQTMREKVFSAVLNKL
ncbi:MAG: hypothetical protein HY220_04460 [Candidatus Sungbacteria bacterium]|uniref:Uncharacterized protein n=1 Tax=Candidatus Sungiibacteriota bacterium TaxID=2750080 RepID=A0A9D6LQX0_9BACT|nr:hypothetical protein [Candidatus Sungbacteria bacterium]